MLRQILAAILGKIGVQMAGIRNMRFPLAIKEKPVGLHTGAAEGMPGL